MSDLALQGHTPEILALESWIKDNVDQEEMLKTTELNHYRIPGVYARELKLKAGTILTGKIHNLDRKSTRLNSSHSQQSRMPSSA